MFTIVELQTVGNETTHLVQTAPTLNDAMSKYHLVLASAAISQVDYHACTVLNEEGVSLARESFIHTNQNQSE